MRKIFYTALGFLLALPAVARAEVVPGSSDQIIPIPFNDQFGGIANTTNVVDLIVLVINMLLFFVGSLSVLFVIIGGIRYVTAHGNEELAEGAKKTIQQAVIGLVITIMSFVMINAVAYALIFD